MTPLQTKIMELLETGEKYTVVDFLRYAHTTESRKIISDLKKEGFEIKSTWKSGNGKKWKEYYL
jgi:predicted TPR repeat methyltransferase